MTVEKRALPWPPMGYHSAESSNPIREPDTKGLRMIEFDTAFEEDYQKALDEWRKRDA